MKFNRGMRELCRWKHAESAIKKKNSARSAVRTLNNSQATRRHCRIFDPPPTIDPPS